MKYKATASTHWYWPGSPNGDVYKRQANSATIAANSFMEEKLRAGNMRILYAPLDPHLLYRSKIIASWLFSSILHLGTAALCEMCIRDSNRLVKLKIPCIHWNSSLHLLLQNHRLRMGK